MDGKTGSEGNLADSVSTRMNAFLLGFEISQTIVPLISSRCVQSFPPRDSNLMAKNEHNMAKLTFYLCFRLLIFHERESLSCGEGLVAQTVL